MQRVERPEDGDERSVTLGWLAFHRSAMAAKCSGLSPGQLVTASAAPSTLTLLGLVRHLTDMERTYGVWALGPPVALELVYGARVPGGRSLAFQVEPSMVEESMTNWEAEMRAADKRIASYASLDERGTGNGDSLRWSLQKLVGEYAQHNAHADILRERIDGVTGQ